MTTDPYDVPSIPPALGSVVEIDRGSLPFALIHGEALVACAAWALGQSGVTPIDLGTTWSALVESGETLVLHDALCPMTPASFLAECVIASQERAAVVVGVRPVTDTVKEVADGYVGTTIDRDALVVVTSPIVLPPEVVESLDGLPSYDFATLAGELAQRFPVVTVEAPAEGRRVGSLDDVRLLEAQTRPAPR
jgi:2-C-methyl-D-erythritol 4-phosphate cytidylyltransferase